MHAHLKLGYIEIHITWFHTQREREAINLLATRRGYNCSQILKRLNFHHPYPILFNPIYNISFTSSKLCFFLLTHNLFSSLSSLSFSSSSVLLTWCVCVLNFLSKTTFLVCGSVPRREKKCPQDQEKGNQIRQRQRRRKRKRKVL